MFDSQAGTPKWFVQASSLAVALAAGALLAASAGATGVRAGVPDTAARGRDQTARDALLALRGPTVLDLFLADGHAVGDAHPQARSSLARSAAMAESRQAPVRAAVEGVGAAVIGAYDTAANALLIHATDRQLELLAAHPEVAAVLPPPVLETALTAAVPHVRAPEAWVGAGLRGEGVNIAVVDTGVDYTHCAFGGPGRAADYAANDPEVVEPGTFPTARVIGGHDFAGSGYTGSGEPFPDSDPLDEAGHGTHVAGIAAGGACLGSEPLAPSSGVAPSAAIVALKIFGRSGSTSLVVEALEWAIESNLGLPVSGVPARVDVLNLSLGSPWALSDSTSQIGAIRRAVDAGITVVAAAGNSGRAAFIVGGPAADAHALAVGSTIGPGIMGSKIRVWRPHAPGIPEDIDAVPADDGLAPPARPAVRAELVTFGRGCDVDEPEGDVAGVVALIERGACTFAEKLRNAENAGAAAAVVFDDGRGIAVMGGAGERVGIPAVMIGRSDGIRLGLDAARGPIEVELSADFDGTFERVRLIDVASEFTSRGPTRAGLLKPDVSAPGTAIRSALIGTGAGSVSLSGTSMASPMAAGAAAIVLQSLRADRIVADPGLPGSAPRLVGVGAADVAALVAHAAVPDAWLRDRLEGRASPLARTGVGRLDVAAAAGARLRMRAGSGLGLGGLDFGAAAMSETHSAQHVLSLRSLAATEQRWRLAVEASPASAPAISYTVSPEVVLLAPGETTAVTLTLMAQPALLPRYDLAGGASAGNADERLGAFEHDARVLAVALDESGEPDPALPAVRVPIYFFGRAASRSVLADTEPTEDASGVARAALSNTGAQAGAVEVFALIAEEPWSESGDGRFNADAIGARVVDGAGTRTLEVAVHTLAARRAPYDASPQLHLDVDMDGEVDWQVSIEDRAFLATRGSSEPTWSGELVTAARRSGGGLDEVSVVGAAWVDVNSNLSVLRIDTAAIGYRLEDPVRFEAALSFGSRFGGVSADELPDGALRGDIVRNGARFDASAIAHIADPGAFEVVPGASADLVLRRDPLAPPGSVDAYLIVFPDDPPGPGNFAVVRPLPAAAVTSAAPSSTPSVTASPTLTPPGATPTPTGSPPATLSPTATGAASPTATATPPPGGSPEPSPSATQTRPPQATLDPSPTPSPSPTLGSHGSPTPTAIPSSTSTPKPKPTGTRPPGNGRSTIWLPLTIKGF